MFRTHDATTTRSLLRRSRHSGGSFSICITHRQDVAVANAHCTHFEPSEMFDSCHENEEVHSEEKLDIKLDVHTLIITEKNLKRADGRSSAVLTRSCSLLCQSQTHRVSHSV